MPVLKSVDLFPGGGRRGAPWVENAPGCDALVRVGVGVGANLVDRLQVAGARFRPSHIRIFTMDSAPEGEPLTLTLFVDRVGGFESGRLTVPDSVATLEPSRLRAVALNVLVEVCREFEALAGLTSTDYAEVVREFDESGLQTVEVSPWKASPDRRYRARFAHSIDWQGTRSLWFEVAERGSEVAVLQSEVFDYASPTSKAPSWDGRSLHLHAWRDHGDHFLDEEVIHVEVDDLRPPRERMRNDDVEMSGLPAVRTILKSSNDPDAPSGVSIGRMINGMPWLVGREFKKAWRSLAARCEADIAQWWRSSGWAHLHITVESTDIPGSKTSTMKDGRDLWVHVHVDPTSARTDPSGAAAEALQEAVDRAARRAKIAPIRLEVGVAD